jgi:hypothetical protein
MAGAGNTAGEQRGRPFRKGQSGNPTGKPKGTRHRTTMAIQELLDGEAEKLTRKCVELALSGDTTALRLCMERLAPVLKSRPVTIELPVVETAADILKAQSAAIQAMAAGEITPDECATVTGVLETKRKAIETVEIEQRIAALEQHMERK